MGKAALGAGPDFAAHVGSAAAEAEILARCAGRGEPGDGSSRLPDCEGEALRTGPIRSRHQQGWCLERYSRVCEASLSTVRGVGTSNNIQADLVYKFSCTVGIVIFACVIYFGFFMELPRDSNQIHQLIGYAQIRRLMAALDRYKADCGQYPTPVEGLDALVHSPGTAGWNGPYLDGEVPPDPWGRAYEYRLSNLQPEIVSYGADGKPGGQLTGMGISSRKLWALSPPSPTTIRARRIVLAVWGGAWVGLLGCAYLLWRSPPRNVKLVNSSGTDSNGRSIR